MNTQSQTRTLHGTSTLTALLRDATLVTGLALATALAAQVKVPLPFTPVPMTLQTMVVVLSGMLLGARRGAASQALYIALGAVGAPFFAGAAGLSVLTGVTGGYLLGFIPSAYLAGLLGRLLRQGRKQFSLIWLAAFVASLPTLFLGALGLKLVLGVSAPQAFALGIAPFLLGDVIKTTLVATVVALKKG